MKLLIALLAMSLVGCAEWTALKSGARTEAALIADEVRDSTEHMLCRGMTIGAWVRAYGNDSDRAGAWRTLCSSRSTETPANK